MRFEKLDLLNFESPVIDGIKGRSFMPPSFIPEEAPAPAAMVNVEPSFTLQDLKAAEQEAYRKGFLEGTKEGQMQAVSEQSEIDQKLELSLEHLLPKMDEIIRSHREFVVQQRQYLPQVAMCIARKIAGDAIASNPMPLLESVIIPCLERVMGEPHIIINVNITLADTLKTRLFKHLTRSSDQKEITVNGVADIPLGDCRIEWTSGKAERNSKALWEQIEAVITDMIISGGGDPSIALPPPTATLPVDQTVVSAAQPRITDVEEMPGQEEPESEITRSLRDAIGDEPLIDAEMLAKLSNTSTEGE